MKDRQWMIPTETLDGDMPIKKKILINSLDFGKFLGTLFTYIEKSSQKELGQDEVQQIISQAVREKKVLETGQKPEEMDEQEWKQSQLEASYQHLAKYFQEKL